MLSAAALRDFQSSSPSSSWPVFVLQEHLSLKKYIVDIVVESAAPPEPLKDGEERQKSKKKARKIKARMNSRYRKHP